MNIIQNNNKKYRKHNIGYKYVVGHLINILCNFSIHFNDNVFLYLIKKKEMAYMHVIDNE